MVKKKKELNNFMLLKIFIYLFILIFSVALFRKLIKSFKESTFDSQYFNFLVFDKNNNSARFFSLKGKNKSILEVKTRVEDPSINNLDKLALSANLGIPIDGVIYIDKDNDLEKNDFSTFIFKHIFLKNQNIINLNKVDLTKIYYSFLFSKIKKYEDKIFNDNSKWVGRISSSQLESLRDEVLINKNITVGIDNESGRDGFGSVVANMLKNVGFNVVSVKTEDENLTSKIIINRQDPDTEKRMRRIFDFPVATGNNQALSDVLIIIGKDY